jgi:hypothetical protein
VSSRAHEGWQSASACGAEYTLGLLGLVTRVGFDTDAWFPDKGGQALTAKAVCAACPVRMACLLHALAEGEEFGIWGGAGEPQRRKLRKLIERSPKLVVGEVARHFERLDRLAAGHRPDEVQVFYGPGATHGRKSTYKRGCRGDACRIAMGLRPMGVPCPTDSKEEAS